MWAIPKCCTINLQIELRSCVSPVSSLFASCQLTHHHLQRFPLWLEVVVSDSAGGHPGVGSPHGRSEFCSIVWVSCSQTTEPLNIDERSRCDSVVHDKAGRRIGPGECEYLINSMQRQLLWRTGSVGLAPAATLFFFFFFYKIILVTVQYLLPFTLYYVQVLQYASSGRKTGPESTPHLQNYAFTDRTGGGPPHSTRRFLPANWLAMRPAGLPVGAGAGVTMSISPCWARWGS